MYRRIFILCVIIFTALGGLTWLGFHAIEIQADGLEGRRWGEFAAVAEQVRRDVKGKLDTFIQTEQNRPYTDYQYYYVPENIETQQRQMPLLRSPLGGQLEHGLAYGHFQIEPDGTIITPYYKTQQKEIQQGISQPKVENYLANIKNNLFVRLNGASHGMLKFDSDLSKKISPVKNYDQEGVSQKKAEKKSFKSSGRRGKSLPIESLQEKQQQVQVIRQRRSVALSNVESNTRMNASVATDQVQTADMQGQLAEATMAMEVAKEKPAIDKLRFDDRKGIGQRSMPPGMMPGMGGMPGGMSSQSGPARSQSEQFGVQAGETETPTSTIQQLQAESNQSETVQIRIEPFVPIVVDDQDAERTIFDGQIFMIRHVQIENRHFMQGFKLNEDKLLEKITESAQRLMRKGMSFELSQMENEEASYTAILDFGFGDLVLNLKEIDPAWIGKQIGQLRNWYFSIITIVFLAVSLGLVSLWRNLREQIKLTQKKDDFISAVSHELRTPLTSIRMYTEMLEKNWIKSEDKRDEYYRNVRQESERLSRLIENVLDFSRIQRGRKKYDFKLGDFNHCVERIIDMMMPYVQQMGFTLEKDLAPVEQTAFDSDAVVQIVISLVDNAVKYTRNGKEKKIIVRTRHDGKYIIIEVEDRGPGLPHYQRKKVFDEFYRCEDEARRESTGVGLGLALVKKFALAHNGFVEILSAKPTGAIFRVALATQI